MGLTQEAHPNNEGMCCLMSCTILRPYNYRRTLRSLVHLGCSLHRGLITHVQAYIYMSLNASTNSIPTLYTCTVESRKYAPLTHKLPLHAFLAQSLSEVFLFHTEAPPPYMDGCYQNLLTTTLIRRVATIQGQRLILWKAWRHQ